MKIGRSLETFNHLLGKLPWPSEKYEDNILTPFPVEVSQQNDFLLAIAAADAAQRKVGVGLTRFTLFRSIFMDEGLHNIDSGKFLLLPSKFLFWNSSPSQMEKNFAQFIKSQLLANLTSSFEYLPPPLKLFLTDSEYTFAGIRIKKLEHIVRELLEFSSQIEIVNHQSEKERVMLFDGYLNCSFLNYLPESRGKGREFLAICKELIDRKVYFCGIIKEGHLLDRAYYEIQRNYVPMETSHRIFKVSSDVVMNTIPDEMKEDFSNKSSVEQTSSEWKSYEEDIESGPMTLSKLEKLPFLSCFNYYIVSLRHGEVLPFLVQLPRLLSERTQRLILKKIIEQSESSHPLMGYPNILNEAHNRAFIGESETEMLENLLRSKLSDRFLNDPKIDLKYEILRTNRHKTR